MIVEASFVFPIMFFVLLFLLYMGNMFYMRSRVDALTTHYTIEAAARYADPLLETVEKNGSVPRSIDKVQPYHSLKDDGTAVKSAKKGLNDKINELGSGFFAGMGIRESNISMVAKKSLINTTSLFEIA